MTLSDWRGSKKLSKHIYKKEKYIYFIEKEEETVELTTSSSVVIPPMLSKRGGKFPSAVRNIPVTSSKRNSSWLSIIRPVFQFNFKHVFQAEKDITETDRIKPIKKLKHISIVKIQLISQVSGSSIPDCQKESIVVLSRISRKLSLSLFLMK